MMIRFDLEPLTKSNFRRILCTTLSLQMLFATPFALAENSSSADSSLRQQLGPITTQDGDAVAETFDKNDQLWLEFAKLKPENLQIPISSSETSLDQDPFFLRSQSWDKVDSGTLATVAASLSLSFKDGRLLIPGARTALKINAPLTPVQVTDDFVFFSLNAGADLFKRASGDEPTGEGLFFIPRSELLARSIDNQPVPIFFFPLGGQGWTGAVDAVELHETETLAVQNREGESVAIELRDVETAMKAQQLNLLLATAMTAKNSAATSDSRRLYPAPGTTAAFGLFFTGLDLNHPNVSLFAQNHLSEKGALAKLKDAEADFVLNFSQNFRENLRQNFSQNAGLGRANVWLGAARTIGQMFGSNPARASVLTPDLIARLVYVGSILTAMLAVSVVVKYTHPGVRMKLKKLRGDSPPTTLGGKTKQEIREIFSVFAHVTTTSAQLAPVSFASAVEIFLDKFAPSMAAADHTLVRRLLKKTYFFMRDTMKNTPVNAKMFLLGALVMGTVDTSFVVVQYMVAIPWIMHALSPLFGPAGQAKINDAFDANNPNTRNLVVNDSVRNGLYYFQSGASAYAMDSRAQIIDGITKEVDTEMHAEGIDPSRPENQAVKNRRIEGKVDTVLKSRGLPSADDFLFDASTLVKAGTSALGFSVSEELATKESFILANRAGLAQNALKRALVQATKYQLSAPSQDASDTVQLLSETIKNMSFLSAIPQGREGIARARQTRQELTILSYEGPVDWMVRYIPNTWNQKYSPASAQAASLLFRQSLYTYLSREGNSILEAPDKDVKDFTEAAEKNVIALLQNDHADLKALSGQLLADAVNQTYKFEKALRLQIEISRLSRERAKKLVDAAYKPAKADWLGRRQEKRARQIADARLATHLEAHPEDNSSFKTDNLWRSFYRDELARKVGLRLESRDAAAARGENAYVELLDRAEAAASENTQNQIKNDQGLNNYLSALGAPEKLQLESSIFTNHYLQAYKSLAIEGEAIPGLAPQQPGRLQRIRQTTFIRSSRVLTRALRLAESFVDDSALKTGWHAALSRNVPLFADLWSSHQRLFKTMLPAMTTGYLWSYYAWQVHMPYGTWALVMGLSAAGVSTPSQWINRAFRMNELKAMDSVKSKVLYAIPYSWATFLGMIPITLFASDANRIYADYIREPIVSILGQVPAEAWMSAAGAAGLIATAAHPKVRKSAADLG